MRSLVSTHIVSAQDTRRGTATLALPYRHHRCSSFSTSIAPKVCAYWTPRSSAGSSKTRLGRLREVMAGFVERGEVPGLVALISRRGETHVEALGTMVTLIVVVIYILTNLSNLVFYWRERRAELNPIWNVAVPVLGIVIFIPVLLASFGIDFAGLGIVSLTPPANAAPWIDLVWLLLGVGLYFYLSARSPAAIRETATTFIEA